VAGPVHRRSTGRTGGTPAPGDAAADRPDDDDAEVIRRVLLPTVAAAAVVVGVALVCAVIVVRAAVLDPATYRSALVTTDAFERAYTELLADPAVADLKEDLLGDLGVPAALTPQFRSLGVNVARWLVPPSTLRQVSESAIDGALAYVRGDTPRLRVEVAVEGIAARVPEATVREVRSLLAGAAERTVTSVPELRDAVGELAEQLAAGEVPAAVPKVGGASFDPEVVATAILDGLGDTVDEDVRAMVLGAVLAGNERDAVIDAAALAVADHAAGVATRLAADPTIELTSLVAARAEQPVTSVVARFDDARALARWSGPWTAVAGVLLAAGGTVALLVLIGRRRAAWWLAGALVASAALVAAGWLVGRAATSSPLAAAGTARPDGWGLPPATAALLADVATTVGDDVAAVVWRCCAVLVLLALVLVAAGAVARAIRAVPVRHLAYAGVGAVALVALSAIVGTRPETDRACNGHVELCDRRYDDVTYAATHNAMSAPDVVPVWPEHDGGLTEQLDAGVRALLIDTHDWPPLESAQQLAALAQPAEPRLPPALAEALYRQLVDVRDGRPGTFLCHIHCAFGAQPLVEGLAEVTAFLDANPHEVVTLIVQDDITPEETVAAFDAADLTRYAHPHDPGAPWPTLGELIDGDERLVVFAEDEGPPPDWYANAFEAMQETPFLFLSADDFSCEENRGDPTASLFQMNHWIQRIAPDRTDAVRVNRLDVLVDRARACADERGRRPNYLAVNFYAIGDVVAAADVLNGVAP
jgi:hypothetical protein